MAIIDNDLFTQPNPSANSPRNNPSLSEEITNLNNEMNSVEDTLVQGYVRESASVSYSSSSSFTISGDKTDVYTAGRIVRFSDGTTGIVSSSSYSSGTTTVNITNGTVPSNLSYVDISLQPKGGTNQFLKASGSDINTGTEDAKIVTPKAIADSNVIFKPGMIIPYAGSSAPSGWLICDGSAVSRTTYSALFAVVGTTYGAGDGSTTFNLPNLKGRVPAGLDTSQTEFNTLGKTGGAKTHTLTINEMPIHNHSLTGTNNNNFTVQAGVGSGVSGIPNNQPTWGSYNQAHWFTGSFTTVNTGGNQPHNNLQPYITLNYIIKY